MGNKAAPDELLKAHEDLWNATNKALLIAKPGRTIHDLWFEMANSLEKDGHNVKGVSIGRMGHGLGL